VQISYDNNVVPHESMDSIPSCIEMNETSASPSVDLDTMFGPGGYLILFSFYICLLAKPRKCVKVLK